MADQNSYVRYKRETCHLLYWMIHASNSIIESSSTESTSLYANATGQLPVSAFVPISKLIAKHISPIPSTIYRLFQSVIAARKAAHTLFQQIAAQDPDPEIEKNNSSHKHVIDVLCEAFDALGGSAWVREQGAESGKEDEENIDEVIFANKFSSLDIHGSIDGDEIEEVLEEDSGQPSTSVFPTHPKGKPAKGKPKKSRGRKKAKGKPKLVVKEPTLDELPLESYRIIEDESGMVTDYLMAVYSLVQQYMDLRQYVQGLWREVSYGGLNSAVAGTMSNAAITMIKQAESAIFVDFPGHDSYETIMKTLTCGDPEKAQSLFPIGLSKLKSDGCMPEMVEETKIDIKEQFSIHTYSDLHDFITDFQTNRSGKPTGKMLKEIKNWDPTFDLQTASQEERIKWRRSFTINWLYDLVNVFSSIVIQRNKLKGENHVLEDVDWSIEGPWDAHRRLFGLKEFAGVITSFAMQKPGTDVRPKILPNHVFQMQCIVDSLTVSRGWAITCLQGHVMSLPAQGFRARRDIDHFMDRKNERLGQGYCSSVEILVKLLEKDAMLHGDPKRHDHLIVLLDDLSLEFVNWLGETMYKYGLAAVPPSRFSHRNANGLWEYSPFLCGVGLMEALELSYAVSFMAWEAMPEPMCVIHLHNMLVQKGYIKQEIGLYATLQNLFLHSFYCDGHVPTSNYEVAFRTRCSETRRETFQRKTIQTIGKWASEVHGMMDPGGNRFFKTKSMFRLYREAGWNPTRIKDEDVPIASALGMLRLGETKHSIDPVTGKTVLENTGLLARARSMGISDEMIIQIPTFQQRHGQSIPDELLALLPEGFTRTLLPQSGAKTGSLGGRELLDLLKLDMIREVSGPRPILSVNYVAVTVRFLFLFHQFEDELKLLHNPLWVRAYEQDQALMRKKRLSLTLLAMTDPEDDECLRAMAKAFESPRSGFMQHIYWEDLELTQNLVERDPLGSEEFGTSCVVM